MPIEIGVLWYDRDPKRSAQDKIDEAVERHVEKFGVWPNACYVHAAAAVTHDRLRIVRRTNILPHHFLVGVDVDPETSEDIGNTSASSVAKDHGSSEHPASRTRRRGRVAK